MCWKLAHIKILENLLTQPSIINLLFFQVPKIYISLWCWLVGVYGISNFVGYLTPNPFLCKSSVLFQTIRFSMSTQSNYQNHFYFKLFNLFKQFLIQLIQFSISTDFLCTQLNFKTVLYITIQFSVSTVPFETIQFSIST